MGFRRILLYLFAGSRVRGSGQHLPPAALVADGAESPGLVDVAFRTIKPDHRTRMRYGKPCMSEASLDVWS